MAKGNLTIGWCDPGNVDSLFMSGLMGTTMSLKSIGIELYGITNLIGNRIDKQRQDLFDGWVESGSDWLLWVDSDIVLTTDIVQKLWDTAHTKDKPVVCGVYFVTNNPNEPLMMPVPCIFKDFGDHNEPIHPLPVDQVIPIDVAGFGLVLMHKSIVPKLQEAYPDGVYFEMGLKDQNKSEDVSFFRKLKEIGVPVYAHTGAIAAHIKRFVFDFHYYNLWWNTLGPELEKQARAKEEQG
jgi:hypothetical protein